MEKEINVIHTRIDHYHRNISVLRSFLSSFDDPYSVISHHYHEANQLQLSHEQELRIKEQIDLLTHHIAKSQQHYSELKKRYYQLQHQRDQHTNQADILRVKHEMIAIERNILADERALRLLKEKVTTLNPSKYKIQSAENHDEHDERSAHIQRAIIRKQALIQHFQSEIAELRKRISETQHKLLSASVD